MRLSLLLLALVIICHPAQGQSQGSGHGAERRFQKGAHSWSLGAGFGWQHRIFNGTSGQRFAFGMPRWTVNLSGRSGQRWTQGNLELGIEGMFGRLLGPTGDMLSLGPMMRYSFPTRGKWTPFVETAGDFFWTNAAMPEVSQRFNFTAQGGIGASLRLNASDAFEIAYRFHHVSNAGQTQPNVGVNSSFLLVAFARYY